MKQNIIIHHSDGNAYGNGESAEQVFDDFNRVGFNRGYAPNGYNFETGISQRWGKNPRTHNGKISYCEYHYILYALSPDQYALVSFIDDREISSGSIGLRTEQETQTQMEERAALWNDNSYTVVFAGDFDKNNVPESMIDYFIGAFKKYNSLYGLLSDDTKIIGHKDTGDPTACPGQWLYTYIPRIEREIKAGL